jgi:hypothetical protein
VLPNASADFFIAAFWNSMILPRCSTGSNCRLGGLKFCTDDMSASALPEGNDKVTARNRLVVSLARAFDKTPPPRRR